MKNNKNQHFFLEIPEAFYLMTTVCLALCLLLWEHGDVVSVLKELTAE